MVLVKNVAAKTFVVCAITTHHSIDIVLSTALELGVRLADHVLETRSNEWRFGSGDCVGDWVSFADGGGNAQGHRESDHKDDSGADEVVD